MANRISHTTMDAQNAYTLSVWWRDALGYVEDPDDPNEPGHDECMIFSPDGGHALLFIDVPDVKQVKNRLHFDLRPTDCSREDEVTRLVGLGAVQLADHRRPDGTGWILLADPEGNEFCVLTGEAQLRAAEAGS